MARCLGHHGDEVAKIRQDCNSNVEQVCFESDGLQVPLHQMASRLPGVCSFLAVACGRGKQHHRQWTVGGQSFAA